MNFAEAFNTLKESKEAIGIRPKSWGQGLCKRYLIKTGVNGTSMFGMHYYDFVQNIWFSTWTVFCPCWREMFNEEWEIVPNEEYMEHRDKYAWGMSNDHEQFILLMINCREDTPEFRERYHQLLNGIPGTVVFGEGFEQYKPPFVVDFIATGNQAYRRLMRVSTNHVEAGILYKDRKPMEFCVAFDKANLKSAGYIRELKDG